MIMSRVSKFTIVLLSCCVISCTPPKRDLVPTQNPNVLLISIDDLNDWTGSLGGHPQALTPNIDRLASEGVLFTNAHCQSPVCNPSRASLMSSLYPSTTGVYFLFPDPMESPIYAQTTLMPERFSQEGYKVAGVGKLFHNADQQNERSFPLYGGRLGGFGPLPEQRIVDYPGLRLWDWGVYPEQDSLMPDHQVADWAIDFLSADQDSSFFLGVGFYRPHVPQFVPQKWFDMYPLDSIQLPKIMPNDLEDVSSYATDLTRLEHVSPPFEWVIENEEWKPLVQSYLACVSFVDYQVGRVLDALEKSPYADNTYVALFSDHGFHLGEKERFAKRSLWADGTQVPLIFAGPGIPKGVKQNQPAELIDIYPTLLDLSDLDPDSLHEGQSLVPLLNGSESSWHHVARTSFGPGNNAIISDQYRYIQYTDASEELYDIVNDPHEWHNLINDPAYSKVVEALKKHLPKSSHLILGEGSTGHKAYYAAEENRGE